MIHDVRISDIVDPSWVAMQVKGRFMNPTFPDCTIIWFDPNDRKLIEGELYVLDLGTCGHIKWYPEVRRASFPKLGKAVMKCDNPLNDPGYRDYDLEDDSSIIVVGMVKVSITLHDRYARLSRRTMNTDLIPSSQPDSTSCLKKWMQ